ncbi:MAG: LamG-like jellyroll fold domain-containing protein [Pirellulaceae bacterium]
MIARRWLPTTFVLLTGLVVGGDLAKASQVASGNDTQNDASNDAADTPVVPDAPLLKWQNFDNAEAGQWKGEKRIEPVGPQSPAHPNFPAGNPAAFFPGDGTSLRVREADLPGTNLRFGLGESITLECWVHVVELRDGQFAYLIGKGRNKAAEFPAENQNYALRLKGEAGEARPSFLFRSAPDEKRGSEYHRWTASEGFGAGTGWHHVAVTYTFGQASSLHGYVDGREVAGTWDMAGKTDRAPVTDGDDLVLGTGNGGGAGNSLQGWLDEVAIYRTVVPEAVFTSRYQFVPPRPAVDAEALPAGRVLVQICEQGVPARNAWPPQPPTVTETYYEVAFGLFEVPHK